MGRNIGATLSLNNGNFFTNMKSAVSAAGGLKSALGSANGALKTHSAMANTVGNTLKSLAGKVLGVVAAYASVSAIKNFGIACVEAANAQTESEKRLEQTMSNVKGTTESQIKSVKKYAAELQGLTTVGDEVSIMGASQLATFQLQSDTIKTLMPSLNDLAVAQYGVAVSGDQMKSMANLVGKVMAGNVSSLSRYGVVMDETQSKLLKTGTESQKAAVLVDVLKQNFGGLSEAMANTPEGRIQQLKNAWGDVQEVVGAKLYPAITSVLTWMTDKIPYIQSALEVSVNAVSPLIDWVAATAIPAIGSAVEYVVNTGRDIYNACEPALSGLKDAFGRLGSAIVDAFSGEGMSMVSNAAQDVFPVLLNTVSGVVDVVAFLVDNFDAFAPALGAVAGAVLAYNVATRLAAMAQWLMNAAMAANPIGILIVAIGALVGAVVALWYKCEGFRNFFIGLWDGLKNTVAGVCDWFVSAFDTAVNGIRAVFTPIGEFFDGLWNGIVEVFSGVGNWFTNAFRGAYNGIKSVFGGIADWFKRIFDGVSNTVKAPINFIIRGLNTLIDGVNKISFDVPSWVPVMGGKKFGFNIPKIPQLATGGIATNPTIAEIGEAGHEAVLPLDVLWRKLDQFADRIISGKKTPANEAAANNNIYITVQGGNDDTDLANKVARRVMEVLNNL